MVQLPNMRAYVDQPNEKNVKTFSLVLFDGTTHRSFDTAAEAFSVVEWLRLELRRVHFRIGEMDLVVVDEQRDEVHRADAHARSSSTPNARRADG